MIRRRRRLALAALILLPLAIAALLLFGDLVSLDTLRARQAELRAVIDAQPLLATTVFVIAFAVIASFAPGAAVLKVAAGALFGLLGGFLIALLATLLGAIIGFLLTRTALRPWVERRFAAPLAAINRGVERDGMVYLLALRFNPLVPFFLINFGLGLTRMRLLAFTGASFVGLMPAALVFANAGTELARITTPADILSWRLIGSLILLSLLPLAGRAAAAWLRRRGGIVADLPGAE